MGKRNVTSLKTLNIPVEHSLSVKPGAQIQEKSLILSMHVPWFSQGSDPQSSMSVERSI